MEWQGHKIEMRIGFSPRYLMFATDTTITVDGEIVGRKGGLGLTETVIGSFDHRGKVTRVELQVRGGLSTFTRIPYVLRIDGVPISQGKLALERVRVAFLVWLLVAALLLLLGRIAVPPIP